MRITSTGTAVSVFARGAPRVPTTTTSTYSIDVDTSSTDTAVCDDKVIVWLA